MGPNMNIYISEIEQVSVNLEVKDGMDHVTDYVLS